MTPAPLVVPARFNGPPGSGNGGYVAGLLAAFLTGEDAAAPVQVTLRSPPPLEVPLDVVVGEGSADASSGGSVVVTAEPGTHRAGLLAPVPFEVAAEAESRYAGLTGHPFPGCFVCGTDRPAGDGLRLRPGRVASLTGQGAGVVATTWVPDRTLADGSGLVDPPFVWAAMDCPGGWASDLAARPMVLGRITATVRARPEPGDRCVVVGRVLGVEGRKTFTASTAYAGSAGDLLLLGHAESTWIAVR